MRRVTAATLAALMIGVAALALRAQQTGDGPRYANGTSLVRPPDYRAWPFLGSGFGLTYEPGSGPGAQATTPQAFTNVFVNPSSYRSFMETGRWQDGTVFVLEFRRAADAAPLSPSGRYQTELVALEAEVKDSRFPDGWAYFEFGRGAALRDVAEPLGGARAAGCVECHTRHTAVERTFVQFYPTLMEVARRRGTVKPGF